jgi:hypothetical protein
MVCSCYNVQFNNQFSLMSHDHIANYYVLLLFLFFYFYSFILQIKPHMVTLDEALI